MFKRKLPFLVSRRVTPTPSWRVNNSPTKSWRVSNSPARQVGDTPTRRVGELSTFHSASQGVAKSRNRCGHQWSANPQNAKFAEVSNSNKLFKSANLRKRRFAELICRLPTFRYWMCLLFRFHFQDEISQCTGTMHMLENILICIHTYTCCVRYL